MQERRKRWFAKVTLVSVSIDVTNVHTRLVSKPYSGLHEGELSAVILVACAARARCSRSSRTGRAILHTRRMRPTRPLRPTKPAWTTIQYPTGRGTSCSPDSGPRASTRSHPALLRPRLPDLAGDRLQDNLQRRHQPVPRYSDRRPQGAREIRRARTAGHADYLGRLSRQALADQRKYVVAGTSMTRD